MTSDTARISPVVLEGHYVLLEPLSTLHLDALCEIGLDPELWRWIPITVGTREEMREEIESALDNQKRGLQVPFAIIEKSSGRAIGSTRYGNIDLANRRLEIGWTWIGSAWQRTAVNTEAKYLLLRHAFESIGCLRVELKTDALNEKSRKAILRIGAKEEGVFRKHMVTASGRIRDTVYYSIVDTEWPGVKAKLEDWLQRPAGSGVSRTQPVTQAGFITNSQVTPVTIENAEHYAWGNQCDGWHLVKHNDLSVIQERVPAGQAEVMHRHHVSRQFFYILEGEATMVVGNKALRLGQKQGVEIPPKVFHQFRNDSKSDVIFLVISVPKSHGDRENVPQDL